MKKRPLVILDAGHGVETAGKRSPVWKDGRQLLEYEFNRDIVKRIADRLSCIGISYYVLVPEENDISLKERCRRANEIYRKNNKNAYLISVHANAGGGTGWECFTSIGDTLADPIASVFCKEAEIAFIDKTMRFDLSDGDCDKEAEFYILNNTDCPTVLTENFFMDYEKDCRFIMGEEGREAIAEMHVEAIVQIN